MKTVRYNEEVVEEKQELRSLISKDGFRHGKRSRISGEIRGKMIARIASKVFEKVAVFLISAVIILLVIGVFLFFAWAWLKKNFVGGL